jgi:hypothetical protein
LPENWPKFIGQTKLSDHRFNLLLLGISLMESASLFVWLILWFEIVGQVRGKALTDYERIGWFPV